MTQLSLHSVAPKAGQTSYTKADLDQWRWYLLPLVFAFAIDLLVPQLIRMHVLPRAVFWLSDLAIFAMMFIGVMRMLLLDHVPKAFLIVLALTAFGIVVAMFEGQNVSVMVLGWRRLFQYPLVGLYVYMMPRWPSWSANWLMRICLFILGFEVLLQLGQFATGQVPSDHLAGTFGYHGVGPLIMFILIVVSFGFGRWLAFGDWRYMVIAMGLGLVSSALGQMKLFPAALLALAGLAFLVQIIKGGQIRRMFLVVFFLSVVFVAFVFTYNYVVSGVDERQFQYYLNLDVLSSYHGRTGGSIDDGFRFGRNNELIYAWQRNTRSTANTLFGSGIGSRAQSETLGISGTYYDTSFYTAGPGRSLPVLLQETGIVGLATITFFILAAIIALYRMARSNGKNELAAVQYGLLLFTALWPLWLWYLPIWLQAVPMILYWATLGFSLNYENNLAVQEYYGVD